MRPELKSALIGTGAGLALSLVLGVALVSYRLHARAAPPPAGPDGDRGPLPVLFDAPAFALTDQDGRPFDAARLAGHAYVADFVFTHCTTFCPTMTGNMADIQRAAATDPALAGLRLASFTVDPGRDTPAVLKRYADAHGADPARWAFLTGPKDRMWDTSRGFKLAVDVGDLDGGPAGMQVMHSSHFLLVDKHGRVRRAYDFKDGGYLPQLLADARTLEAAD